MTAMDYGNLAYLVLLGAVILIWFVSQNQVSLNKNLQYAAIWGLIFVGGIAVVGLWGDIRRIVEPRAWVVADTNRVEVPRGPDGHYRLTLEINGTPVEFVVDTGASMLVLTRQDAAQVGVPADDLVFTSQALTANGVVGTAAVRLDTVALGPFEDTGVRALVNEGEMSQSLLGMTYLNRFARIEITNGRLILER